MLTKNQEKRFSVSKIAIVNPYLQGGHLLIAESETAARFVQAGKNLSIDIQVFASCDEVIDFDPDFVINITYQEGKLTHYPTYVSLNIPIFFLKDVPRFIRNILTCDGFLTVSPSVSDWLYQLCKQYNKEAFISHTAFSVPETEFVMCDFKNALAMYIGTNWDGFRHQDIFHYLSNGKYLKCFGPENSWKNYPRSLYGGKIPFDGTSVFNSYRKHAAGLCIGHPEFDKAGVANTRIFEIAASSALPICMNNELTRSIYQDSVLYLDHHRSTDHLAGEISSMVQWIRSHPEIAQEMAKEAHNCFNRNASMEFYLKNLIETHERVMNKSGFLKETNVLKHATIKSGVGNQLLPKVAYILPVDHLNSENEHHIKEIINNILNQTYSNIELIILTKEFLNFPAEFLKEIQNHSIKVKIISNPGSSTHSDVLLELQKINPQWIGILSLKDKIFKNHTLSMINTYNKRYKKNNITALFTGCLEYSTNTILPELTLDEHNIANYNKTRISHVKFSDNLPLVALLFHANIMKKNIFKNENFFMLDNINLLKWIKKKGKILENSGVTCAVCIDSDLPA